MNLLIATDERYAMQTAACLASVICNTYSDENLKAWVLDGGLSPESRRRIKGTCAHSPTEVLFVPVDNIKLQKCHVSRHVTRMTYARLMVSTFLPSDLHRIIYLDADTMVLSDLKELWETPLNGAVIGAVQDQGAPYFDARCMPNFEAASRFLVTTETFHNLEELNLPRSGAYFNAGVMLIDLCRWRASGSEQALWEFVSRKQRNGLFWDQAALNAVFCNKWNMLDSRWNAQSSLFNFPSHKESHLSKEEFERTVYNPAIVHFSSSRKPWHFNCPGALKIRYFSFVDQTPWVGWRPKRSLREEFDLLSAQLRMTGFTLKNNVLALSSQKRCR